MSVESLLFHLVFALQFSSMEREISRARLLCPNQVREIVMDSDSDEEKYSASEDTEDDESRPPSRWSSISQPSSPDFSASSSEDEDDVGNVAGQQPQPCLWTLPPQSRRHVVHTFIGAPKGKSIEAAHVTSESTPLSVLLLFFTEIITLLVVETNRYHQFLEHSGGPSPDCDVTEAEMFAFLALTLQMGHTVQGKLEDYWTNLEQLRTPFYGQMMTRARYCHILRFLHFTDNKRNGVHRKDDQLWEIRDLFEIIRTNFSKFYSPSEHLAVAEVIVKFNGKLVFKQYIQKKSNYFGIKLFKLCDSTGYTYDMNVYLGKDRQTAAQHLTATHNTVANLTRSVEGFGHKLYMNKFFSSPDLYDDLAQKKIFCCGTVGLHRKGMPKDLKPKTLRLKRGDIRVRTRGDLTAVVWKDKRDVCFLTNIHDPPREGNYRDEHGNAIKPAIVADYNRHMGLIDNADRMANRYTASRQTWKWTTKLFFHLLDLAIINSYILLSSCGGKKISHRDFRLTLIREMLARSEYEPRPSFPVGRPGRASANIRRLDTCHNEHWPGRNRRQKPCYVCSARGVTTNVVFKCVKCDVVLCVGRSCFEDYHTKNIL